MRYTLIGNYALLVNRKVESVSEKLRIAFDGVEDGAIAVFITQNNSYYGKIKDGACEIPSEYLSGTISVGLHTDISFKCQGFICDEVAGVKFVYPNDENLPNLVNDLIVDIDKLKIANIELGKRIKTLEEEYDALFNGHDIV